jgi:hypothetical protein
MMYVSSYRRSSLAIEISTPPSFSQIPLDKDKEESLL